MPLLRTELLLPIARHARHRTAHRPRDAVRDAGAVVVQLTLRFLPFAERVLAVAFLF